MTSLRSAVAVLVLALLVSLVPGAGPLQAAWQGAPPKIDPAAWPAHSPERALAAYLLAWHNRDWAALARTCLPSWSKSDRMTPKGVLLWLKLSHGQNRLVGARVLKVEKKSSTFAIGRALLWYGYKNNKTYRQRLEILMSREDAQGRETAKGEWGVLPTSFSTKRVVD